MIQEYLAHHDNYPNHKMMSFVLNDFQLFSFVGLSRNLDFQSKYTDF